MPHRYAIITPCRNEAEVLPRIIADVASQTVPPSVWVLVDDGSTDTTAEVLEEACKNHPFIRVVTRADRGFRAVGPGVIDAFYAGFETIDLDDFDFICKLDADLELPHRYFETAFNRFDADPYLGNLSGKVFYREDRELVDELLGDENACGAAKLYRVECFRQIGGFVREVSWDGIDGHMCRLHGWIACADNDPELRIIEQRKMGVSQVSLWEGRKRWGRGKYFMGSSLIYVFVASIYRMAQRPYFLLGLGILTGYLGAAWSGMKRYDNADCQAHLRAFELRSLLFGKKNALNHFNRKARQLRRRA